MLLFQISNTSYFVVPFIDWPLFIDPIQFYIFHVYIFLC